MGTPATLPGDFFDKKQEAPETLPANFFDRQSSKPTRPTVEMPPFPVDEWLNHQIKDLPPEQQAEKRDKFASVMHDMAKPWMEGMYSATAGLNRGMANFATELDLLARHFERVTGAKRGGAFEDAAKAYEANADLLQSMLPKDGVTALDKVYRWAGESAGSMVPGTAQFLMDRGSALYIPYVTGDESARLHGEDPTIAGIIKAGQVGMLATMFKMVEPLKAWMKAGVLGTYFGADEAINAKPGERAKGFLQGAATGGLLGITTPGGEYGLRDIYPEIARNVPKGEATASATPVAPEGLQPAVQKAAEGEQAAPEKAGTEAGAASDTALFQQAKQELGPEASVSDVAKRAQELKQQPNASASVQGPDMKAGFTNPDGKFLDGEQAREWVKENEPDTYATWKNLVGEDDKAGLTTEDYNAAKEINREPDPDLRELTTRLRSIPADTPLKERIGIAQTLTKPFTGIRGGIENGLANLKAAGAAAWDWYKNPPQSGGIRGMIDRYKGAKQITGIENVRFSREIKGTFSDRTQRALTAYAQAGGDTETLTRWAEASTDPVLKEKYQDALSLNDDHKKFAQDYRAHMDGMLDRAIDAGILDHGVENYVAQIYEKDKDNAAAKRMMAESNAGLLRKNPFLAKKRIYESYFDAEQNGKTPKDARLGYLVSAYHTAFDEALNARSFLKALTEETASDGRPMAITAGVGASLPKGDPIAESWVIKPRAVTYKATEADPVTGETTRSTIDTADYSNRGIDHPALRKWKWVGSDGDGNPIYLEGDLMLHPEAYQDVKNFLGTSAVRKYAIGRAALKVSTQVKGTMLGFFSTFHQVHLGKTVASYGVSPFNPGPIDLEDPTTRALIEHGHILYDGNAMAEWSEGVAGPGLIKYIPKVGEYAERYTDYMFGADGYVARLKNKLGREIYERNAERYPELSRDDLLTLSANESNAALGGQNWRGMGANKTVQDLMRMGALAPDFLVSRARLTGQMFKPYGREQFNAIAIRGAIGLYVAAKVIEGAVAAADPDNNEVHWDRPFSVTIDGKEYTIRSQQGDIYHFIQDPRSFAYYRLNPAISKPAIEMITGRDRFGRLRDPVEQLKDWATSAVPIAGQGFFQKQDYSLYQSVLASIGVSSWDFRSDANQLARQISAEKNKAEFSDETGKRIKARTELKTGYDKTGDFEPIRKAWADGQIAYKDVAWIINRNLKGDLPSMVSGFTVDEALKVWKQATQEEKAELQPILVQKWARYETTATPGEVAANQDEIDKVMTWQPTRPLKQRRRFSIQ